MQQAYRLGSDDLELGGRSAHFYLEVDFLTAGAEEVEEALNRLIARHDMLRAVVRPDGRQQVLAEVPRYRVRHADLAGLPEAEARSRLEATRAELSGQVFDHGSWPLYEVRGHTLADGALRLHLSVDLVMLDASSVQLLLTELIGLVLDPDREDPPPAVVFRDVVQAAAHEDEAHARARRYWLDRLAALPPSPRLPVRPGPMPTRPAFTRRQVRLPAHAWEGLRGLSRTIGVTPSVLLCAAYAEVLRVWSASARFTLNLTLADRPALHADVERVVGDFTGTLLLECDLDRSGSVAESAATIQARLRADLAHTGFGGVRVRRELARRGGRADMPVVFTSLLREPGGLGALEGVAFDVVHAVSQTPQVYLDNQALLLGGGLVVAWDAVDEVFPAGVLDDMFTAYVDLLDRLARDEAVVGAPTPVSPPARSLAVRARVNDTAGPLPEEPIHAAVDRQVALRGDAPAVITDGRVLTFRELDARANQVAHRVRALGAGRGDLVGVVMHKGWEQVVAVLGVVRAGAAYLPVDAGLPAARIAQLLSAGRVSAALTQVGTDLPAGVAVLAVGERPWEGVPGEPVDGPVAHPDDLAYVIFTSGSTGVPKGVMTSHRSAVNTLSDVNERFGVGPDDRVLGVSSLSFDLSVYDVFGVLGAGGAVVLPGVEDVRDPGRLAGLARRYGVTLWNTVPALFEMLVEHGEQSGEPLPGALRLVLLSGDWIPLSLPGRVSGPALHGLGGATEAAIWSTWHPITGVEPGWRSIPYGTPLRNQSFHVLDEVMRPKPDLVPGELFIGGAGVARGYWEQPARTAESFPRHPVTGERLYRTGDLGRYLPDGSIEFLGRRDDQVKIGGHRVEPGEVEAVLGGHAGIRTAVVVATGEPTGAKRLVAYAVPAAGADVDAAGLTAFLGERLPAYSVPAAVVLLPSLPLSANGKVDRAALPAPEPDPVDPPSTPVERALARAWTAVLGVERVGRHDDFFALGGDSLLGMRVVARIAEQGLHLTAGEFHRNPTVARQAAVARTRTAVDDTPGAEASSGAIGLTPGQRWFFELGLHDPDHWNGMWPVFEVDRLDTDPLARALHLVVGRHEALRTRFRARNGRWTAEIADPAAPDPAAPDPVVEVSLADVPDDELERRVGEHVAERNASLDLADGPLVRLTYFDLGPARRPRLLVSAHWLVMDYYSSRVFFEDLRTAYSAMVSGEPPRLPPRTASLSTCLARLEEHAASDDLAAELPRWSALADLDPPPLPVDHRLGENTQASAARHFVRGGKPAARDELLTALVRAVTAWTGQTELLVELEGHGRGRAFGEVDVSRTVARLSTLTPVLLRADGPTPVRDQLAAVPDDGAGYGVLRHLHPDPGVRDRLAAVPRPQVGFNSWGDVSEFFSADARPLVDSFGHHRGDLDHRPRVLDLTALVVAGELWLIWGYSTNLHRGSTIRALADRFTAELAAAAGERR
ncbi:amino acid adenylation domain-containing protein [Saccharothrix sp. BKS2]|uniref:amino acid adenylation domain-containing protein n=1 Tax=Saccharothrix sp. BKS2 TaxID=3064400 RepID=UPI0039EAB333